MNDAFQLNLAMILFLPWFAILAALYWFYPRQPRHWRRRLFDLVALIAATALAVLGTHWSVDNADTGHGEIWKQILASSISYGAFLGVMLLAMLTRWVVFIRPGRR
ncbi:MAG: hypothetical protein WCZ65_00025 [Lysobacteraceae bacterium]